MNCASSAGSRSVGNRSVGDVGLALAGDVGRSVTCAERVAMSAGHVMGVTHMPYNLFGSATQATFSVSYLCAWCELLTN